MDDKEKQLYNEENLELQKKILAKLEAFTSNQPMTMHIPQGEGIDGKALTKSFEDSTNKIVEAVKANNLDKVLNEVEKLNEELAEIRRLTGEKVAPTEISVKNIEGAKTDSVKVNNLYALEKGIETLIDQINKLEPNVTVEKQDVRFPNTARDYVAVRLTNGKEFYEAMFAAASGGGPTTVSLKANGAEVSDSNPLPVDASISLSSSDIEIGAVEIKNATTDDRATVSAAGALKVDNSAVTQPVSGTVSVTGVATAANQTTGNTSLSGINTDTTAIAASASVLDDWDESDRAKVNSIVGQAGVAAGSGTTGATVQRVVLATDTTVPNVTGSVASGATDSGNPVKVAGKYNSSAPTFTDGQRGDIQIDANGNQKTREQYIPGAEDNTNNVIVVNHKPVASSTYTGTAFSARLNDVDISVKGSAGNLLSITASSINAAIRYLQIHNKATAPAGGDTPVFSWPIPAGTATVPAYREIGRDILGQHGHYFSTGISVGISTTADTFTAATTTDHVTNGTYI